MSRGCNKRSNTCCALKKTDIVKESYQASFLKLIFSTGIRIFRSFDLEAATFPQFGPHWPQLLRGSICHEFSKAKLACQSSNMIQSWSAFLKKDLQQKFDIKRECTKCFFPLWPSVSQYFRLRPVQWSWFLSKMKLLKNWRT